MEQTVIGLFENQTKAQQVMQALEQAGFQHSKISSMAGPGGASTATQTEATPAQEEPGVWDRIKSFFAEIGLAEENKENEQLYFYKEGIRSGKTLVTVQCNDTNSAKAAQIMEQYGALNVDDSKTATPEQMPAGATSKAASSSSTRITGAENTSIPIVQERLNVGKQEVQRGGVRVYQRISQQPVEQQINLREEHVTVERRAANRPATEADWHQQGTLEMVETAEVPLVAKEARVVEEVVIGKQATEHTETLRDTVQHTDVHVERFGPEATSQGFQAYENDFRSNFTSRYANSGYGYEYYSPAYLHGYNLASDQRYGDDWTSVEPQARSMWEQHNPNTWDQFKEAVRYSWEKVKGIASSASQGTGKQKSVTNRNSTPGRL